LAERAHQQTRARVHPYLPLVRGTPPSPHWLMPWAFLGTPIKSHAIIIATSLSGVLQPMTSEAGCNEVLHLFSLKLLASLGTLVCLFYFLFSLKIFVPLALLCAPTLYPTLLVFSGHLYLGTVSVLMSEFTGDPLSSQRGPRLAGYILAVCVTTRPERGQLEAM
jgi:hypothetical protein